MKKNTYVAIVGLPGSGKTVAAQFFRLRGFSVLRFGDVTDNGLAEQGLPLTEANERKYREEIRAKLGMGAMAIKIEPRIREAEKTSSMIALDGMRSFEEYVYLKEKFPGLIVLCIYASPAIRYHRLATRKERPLTTAESQSRDYAEIENLHSGGPIAMADYLIQNESTPESFEALLNEFLQSLP